MTDDNQEQHPRKESPRQDVSWTELGQELWAYLTGRGAAINYTFVAMTVEVPRDTGPDAPRATWKVNGTLRITTSDDEIKEHAPAA